jgi:hypothetical protein
MDVHRRVLHRGPDSWEGEMTYQGLTFIVEAMEQTNTNKATWEIEVLRHIGGRTVEPLSFTQRPTLEDALDEAERIIRQFIDTNP